MVERSHTPWSMIVSCRRQRNVCGDFINCEDLPAQYLKMHTGIEIVFVHFFLKKQEEKSPIDYIVIREQKKDSSQKYN